jgi:ketosteroid isomerase-like protein
MKSQIAHPKEQIIHPKEIVLSFVEALNNEDFKSARSYISDDLAFKGVMASLNGGDNYMKDMGKMKIKYAVKKVTSEGGDVSLLYDFTQSGTTLPGCGWYHVENGKIHSLTVLFDPRPLMEKK